MAVFDSMHRLQESTTIHKPKELLVFPEIKSKDYGKIRALFQPFDYILPLQAVLEGNNPGRIFVDDLHQPSAALALTPEGTLLAGDDSNPDTLQALRRTFQEIFTGQVFSGADTAITLAVHPPSWEVRLPELIPTHEIEQLDYYYLVCRELKFDWRSHLPEGYAVHRVDQALLHSSTITIPDDFMEWSRFEAGWGSVENFLEKGAGFAVVHEGQAVSWCSAVSVAGDQIEVGILTLPAHRRRGLAAVATAATVEHCLRDGFKAVSWQCNSANTASWKTAEKVGFVSAHEHKYYYYIFDQVDHLAELGWYHFQRDEHEKTRHYYEQVFARREDNPDYYYHLAAITWAEVENAEKALEYLRAAAQRGWSAYEYTRQHEAFGCLHGRPEWEAVLNQMEENAA